MQEEVSNIIEEMEIIGFMTKICHMVKISHMIGKIRILVREATLEIIETEVTEYIIGIEKGGMTEIGAELEITEEDMIEVEVEEIQDLEVEEDQCLETKVKR